VILLQDNPNEVLLPFVERRIYPIKKRADGSQYIVTLEGELELSELQKRFDPRMNPVPLWVQELCFGRSPE
jgi:hypothetical protein